MLEKADLTLELSKEEHKKRMPILQERLMELHTACWKAQIPSIILFEGWDAAGKGTVNLLTQRLEPRGFRLTPFKPRELPSPMPWLWRFLRTPTTARWPSSTEAGTGRAGQRVERSSPSRSGAAFEDITDFERTLADDGYLIVKFFHISKAEQKRRFKAPRRTADLLACSGRGLGASQKVRQVCHRHRGDVPTDRGRMGTVDYRRSHRPALGANQGLQHNHRETGARADGPWQRAAAATPPVAGSRTQDRQARRGVRTMLDKLKLDRELSQEKYERRLQVAQLQLRELAFQLYSRKRSLVVVYEGWDAAGKGGNIRRVTEKLDPRGLRE
jgi:polyphosphate kinase 2 (PPK2 family)